MRMYWIANFHLKVMLLKLVIFAVAFPVSLVWLCGMILRGRESPAELLSLFNPFHWQDIIGEHVEALVGCRWFIEGAQSRPSTLPRYCFYDFDSKLICCLHVDDAVMLNMKHGGTVKRRPNKESNNARQIPAV